MIRLITTTILFFATFVISLHSQNLSLNGYVKNKDNNEAVIDAVIQFGDLYTTTNAFGHFSFTYSPTLDSIVLTINHVGFEPLYVNLLLKNDTVTQWYLEARRIQPLTVIAQHRFKTSRDQMAGAQTIEASELSEAILLAGESDIIKYLALQSGVATGVEGYAQISVRGGGLFENQYYLDGIPMYNTGHFLGLSSIFNGNIIKKADFYKGQTPSQYGGRLSSYTAIETKSGNSKKWEFNGDLGLIDSDISIEGPLFKHKKSSVILSSRAFYAFPLVNEINKTKNGTNFYFYDLNFKTHLEINDKSKLELSYYYGNDKLNYNDNKNDIYGQPYFISTQLQNIKNAVLSLRYANAIDKNHFFTWHLGHTSNTADLITENGISLDGITDYTKDNFLASLQDFYSRINIDKLLPNNFRWISGLETNVHNILPGQLNTSIISIFGNENIQFDKEISQPNLRMTEANLYTSIDGHINSQLRFQGGLRLSSAISDKTFVRLEPRLGLYYEWRKTTFKASANIHHQYLHPLIFGDSETQPLIVWLISDQYKKPQSTTLLSLGLVRNIFNKNILFSFDAYYKTYRHLTDIKNTTMDFDLFFTPINYLALEGRGRAFGFETTTEAYLGEKLKLNLIYSWSKSFRQYDEINQGKEYPFKFNREHSIVLNSSYRISDHWKATSNFIFNSGHRFTYPPSIINNSNIVNDFFLFTGRNNVQLQAYHRLDLGFQWYKAIHDTYWFGINFGVYNLYGKKNPISAFPELTGPNEDMFIVRGLNILQAAPYFNIKLKRIL